jgi:fatty acid desaturase
MKKNMGSADRIIRVVLAIVIAALYFTHVISGTLALVLLIVVAIFIITSTFSFCPLYLPFGISTKKKSA